MCARMCVRTHEEKQTRNFICSVSYSYLLCLHFNVTSVLIFQAQINVMGNRQSGSNSSHVPAHVDSDNSASAHSTPVGPQSAAAAGTAPSAPPDSGASTPQTETSASNTDQTQDSPQTQARRPQGTAQGELHSKAGMYFVQYTFFKIME
jgi:hypothetical protein